MNVSERLENNLMQADTSSSILKLAIHAVGGQGGGVLSNWVADLAELGGYDAQVTSVAGVAQRTGATIYYVEMAPKSGAKAVFALSPTPGDVDVLIASELMEAGRALQRGFVTPDRTTMIASSHRILAVSEKQTPGDGRGDSAEVRGSLVSGAKDLICFDMEKLALENGSVISSSLFGGLARSKALPFPAELYEEVIRKSGKGVEASLQSFRAVLNFDEAAPVTRPEKAMPKAEGPRQLLSEWAGLERRVADLPETVQAMAHAGLRKVVDYQDLAYGAEYLDHLNTVLAADSDVPNHALTDVAAKYIANAMCYDDIIRVADLKTRGTRSTRLRQEQQIPESGIVQVTEYFHPRTEELISILPAGVGRQADGSPWMQKILGMVAGNGKRLRTDKLSGFLMLWLAAGLRPMRRRLLRHATEATHLGRLMDTALTAAKTDCALGVEVFKCQRLIKGYSDTHARGHSKFDKVLSGLASLSGRSDAADWLRRLREAALQDENGEALEGALKTIQSFTDT
ncbi:indolepyruvate oxidoreductase subunit beta family protein [Labrenzia sp. PHM005]|uniref:indolepyruvate oxidoreductase subunit beta family protein n=1 Tax=Labrenzia sp. PHM005 TaxID=2590016 RepID=UPI001FFD7EE2|nr:indolepyruvate oxidoreductase subunit beta family protein [Labrenzia sp. PHM005]